MKIAVKIVRFVHGLGFTVFGANIIHPFLPMPPMDPASLTAQFMAVMVPTHWMTLVGFFQLFGGLLVLFGGTAPIGLSLLGPVLVNILAFHICIQHGEGIAPGLVFTAMELFLLYAYRSFFTPIFTLSAEPTI